MAQTFKSLGGYPVFFHVLPHEKAAMADEIIATIREKDKYLSANLAQEMDRLRPFTVRTYRKDLVVGCRYGVFGVSPFANAVRDGKIVPNHGEVYLHVWTLGDDGIFYTHTAWDGVLFDAYPCRGQAEGILVEL